MKKIICVFISAIALLACFAGCGEVSEAKTLHVISGSENKELAPVIERFEKEHKIKIDMQYKGSVDIMHQLQQTNVGYDAVWPANSMWISIGDTNHVVKLQESIMTSPVVFGIKKSVAEKLGFVGKQVSVKDILAATTSGDLKFIMTSATQSNSGASAYFGFLYALSGNPEVLQSENLDDSKLKQEMKTLLSGINRSSGSSEWLKELFLEGDYQAMVNYESVIINTNQQLVSEGKEPLYVVYPYDGLSIADSPLGFISSGNSEKEALFKEFQSYLLSDEIQKELLQYGRRTGIGGTVENPDTSVFNPEWGIDASKPISPIKTPSKEVVMKALSLYQTELRKPSYTVYCLDYSGSMAGEGEQQLKQAMETLLDKQKAEESLLQMSPEDVTVVIPFNSEVLNVWNITGNDSEHLAEFNNLIQTMETGGGTNIYDPCMKGLETLREVDASKYSPAIILMTDGESNNGSFSDFRNAYDDLGKDIPVFTITFGAASQSQVAEIAELTHATVFDGSKDLIAAFKKAKGYN